MRPDRGAVDHTRRVQIIAAVRQSLRQDVPYAGLTPAAEPSPDRIPVAELLRKVAPWHAAATTRRHTLQDPPVIGEGRSPRDDAVLRKGSTVVHSPSVIRPRITVNLLAKRSAVNHTAAGRGNRPVKKDMMRIRLCLSWSLSESPTTIRILLLLASMPSRAGLAGRTVAGLSTGHRYHRTAHRITSAVNRRSLKGLILPQLSRLSPFRHGGQST